MDATVVFTQHQKMLPPVELVWVFGSAGTERGKRFPLMGGRLTFGRASDNSIILPDSTVSIHHGVLVYAKEGEVLFYDTASRNGISIDGKRSPMIKLKLGRKIQIGSVYLKLVPAGQSLDVEVSEKRTVLHPASLKKKQAWMPIGTVLLCLASFPGFLHPVKAKEERPAPVSVVGSTIPADPKPVQKEKPLRRARTAAPRREPRPEPQKTGFVEAGKLFEESLMTGWSGQ